MNGFLAVARREIAQRQMLFVAAAIAAVAPFAVPFLRGLHGDAEIEARSATALACSAAFLYAISAFLGGTVIPRAIADRRIGFDFARPLSSWAIWGGTLLGTITLATGSALIAWGPAALAGDAAGWSNLADAVEIPLPWPVLVLGASLLLFALFQVAGVAIRSRSLLLAVDLLLIPVALFAAWHGLLRLQGAGASTDVKIRAAVMVLAFVGLLALLLAGFAAVARGRTEIRAAHAAQSLVLWATIAAGILVLHSYGWWLFSANPSGLTEIRTVRPAPVGSWVLVDGVARDADASFLYDTRSRRSARVPWGVGSFTFSEDGLRAGWIQKLGKSTRLRIVDLDERQPSPETRATLASEAAGLIFDATGSRVAVIENEGISVHDLRTGRLLVSARISAYSNFPRAFFVNPDLLRIYWFSSDDKTRLDILELEVPRRRLVRTGTIDGLTGWPLLATDRSGHRLACFELDSRRLRLFDARTGQFIAPLLEPTSVGAAFRFLYDGRIIVVSRRESERVLEVRSLDGARLRRIVFPGGPLTRRPRSTTLGAETLPGHVVVATGEFGAPTAYLISVDQGQVRRLDDHLEPVSRWLLFFGTPNVVPPPGAEGSKLFQTSDGALIRLDPVTGERRVVLGLGAR